MMKLQPKTNRFLSKVESWCWIISMSIALIWTTLPASVSILATLTLPAISTQLIELGSDRVHLEIQRDIQKHYLSYGVYLPLEDIFYTKDFAKVDSEIHKNNGKVVW